MGAWGRLVSGFARPTGSESRLTKDSAAEAWPAASPDGARIAYVSIAAASRKLHVLTVDNGQDSTVLTDARVERPTWSPAGDRLAWTATGARGAVYVSPLDGHYVNVASARHAESAWNPDGKTITLVDLPPTEPIAPVGYNGDPDRTGDREANLLSSVGGRMWTIAAPVSPDLGLVEQQGSPAVDRAMRNADTFDQLWDRTAALYYSAPDAAPRRAQWESLKAKYRSRAVAAKTDDELASVLHELLREHPPYKQAATGRAAVSSAHPVATAAGLEMLAKGGNVVDAAVAVSFALGVVEPDASGPGGYGQMLVYTQGLERPQLIEFMSRVPEDAGLTNTSLLTNGRLPDGGPAVANVPGTVAAMYLAWQKFGSKKIPWADLLQPAIRAARDGYVVSEGLATTLATERDQFLKYDGSRALFFRDGEPLHAGDTVKNPDLAWTLEQIARGGADAFYKGEIATKMVADLRAHGNVMKPSDLARYFAAERDPVSSTYRGYTLFSSAPPVAGGAELAAKLNSLEAFGSLQPYPDDADIAARDDRGVAARAVDAQSHRRSGPLVRRTSSRSRTRTRRGLVGAASTGTRRSAWRRCAATRCAARDGVKTASVELARPPECIAHGYDANQAASCRAAGTTAFVVADAAGNVVAATQTLGTWGGNFYVSPGLGFIYNDKLSSYGTEPGGYGARVPFARHGSTIAPTIVFEGSGRSRHAVMARRRGGQRVDHVGRLSNARRHDGRTPRSAGRARAAALPRWRRRWRRRTRRRQRRRAGSAPTGATIQLEDGFSPQVMKRLDELGYRTQLVSLPGELREGYGAAVRIEGGRVTAGADPRRAGAAGAIP